MSRKVQFFFNRRHDLFLKYHKLLGPNNILIGYNDDVPVTKATVAAAILARHRFVHNVISNLSKYIFGVDAIVNIFTIKNLNVNSRWSCEDVVGVTDNILSAVHPILHSQFLTTDGITPINYAIDATNRSVISSNVDNLAAAIINTPGDATFTLNTSDHSTLSADNVTVTMVQNTYSIFLTPNVPDALDEAAL